MSGKICKARKQISKHGKSIADRIADKIGDIKKDLYQSGVSGVAKIKKTKKDVNNRIEKEKNKLKNLYLGQKWRHKRPDVTFLVELILVVVLGVILYYAWPYLTGSVKPAFSKSQFEKASQLPTSSFSLEDVAKVDIEVNALRDYADFFKSNPYSLKNNGIRDLLISAAVLPFIMFFVQFVLPPFVVGYIIWFIVRFWKYVIAAAWGWFLSMYSYFTRLIQGKLGCKWYIRMVTGWGCNSPNFYSYFVRWRRRYIDRPIYYEKLKYIRKYYWARQHYYIIPWHKYITVPLRRYKLKAQFAKKVYIDRSIEVFLKKLRDMYPQYYSMPRNEFYKWLLGNNRHLAGVYAKAMQAKAQIEGKPYRSITENGNQCTCPATKTPAKAVVKTIKKQAVQGKKDLKSLIDATNNIYDKLNSVNDVNVDCNTFDDAVTNRRKYARNILGIIIVTVVVLYIYSVNYGTPSWLKNIISPTAMFVSKGVNLVNDGRSFWTLPIIYLITFSLVMTAVWLF